MKVGFIILAAVLVLVALLVPIYLLFFNSSALPQVRDVAIVYSTMFMCVGAILFIAMTGLLAMIAFMIRDHVVPALEKVDETAKTVRGTAAFVSESVVSPIIKVAGAGAGARAMVQTLMRRDTANKQPKPKKEQGS
jgi:hypothetical protein